MFLIRYSTEISPIYPSKYDLWVEFVGKMWASCGHGIIQVIYKGFSIPIWFCLVDDSFSPQSVPISNTKNNPVLESAN